MRLATYNVNGVNARLEHLLRWLATTSPDIVCLQELKTTDGKFPAAALAAAGYGAPPTCAVERGLGIVSRPRDGLRRAKDTQPGIASSLR
ncbi:MAG: endonuclease/exonuclease/phosphatase family protein, partial [Proteobacteria bacterium]|nr:endonuclease/exonuclease/phosphatase family protein [Pseudomonadota bacterium]